jgi:hypothetical protein
MFVNLFGYKFYELRLQANQQGTPLDDCAKAEYAYSLMKYLYGHGRTKADDENDNYCFLLSAVARVYETAYFIKLDNPSTSDLDCFAAAELRCIESKKHDYVDFVAYYEYRKRLALGLPGNEKSDYENATRIQKKVVAYKFYRARQRMHRQGNPLDDYIRAEYALSLAKYLENHGKQWRAPPADSTDRRDEYRRLLDVVNYIWDEAYFLKLKNPEMSDLDCFATAERRRVAEKEIDRIAHS